HPSLNLPAPSRSTQQDDSLRRLCVLVIGGLFKMNSLLVDKLLTPLLSAPREDGYSPSLRESLERLLMQVEASLPDRLGRTLASYACLAGQDTTVKLLMDIHIPSFIEFDLNDQFPIELGIERG